MKKILLILSWVALAGCASQSHDHVARAIVTRVDVSTPRPQIVITDATQFQRLLSFFPDLPNEQTTDLAGGWEGKYEIVFHLGVGSPIKVMTSYDDQDWSSGKGDKFLKPGLSDFLDPMF